LAWQQILLLSSSSDAGVDRRCTAAHATGARRLVAQSFTGWAYARTGGPVKSDPPAKLRATLDAIRYLEQAVLAAEGIEGIVLRYGWFYGPGTALHAGGKYLEAIRRRQFPIIGDGTGVWSFIHIDDVASATLSAIERGAPGVYNIVDDEPAPVAEWLPFLASTIDAPPPRHIPAWLGRPLMGEHGLAMMNETRAAANTKAKRQLGWQPRYASWREGFRNGLAD
jgi:nucleoside-diphosphate-sugar epimerase